MQLLADTLGDPVVVNRITGERWKRSMRGRLPDDYAQALLDYWEARERHPARISTAVPDLLGRPATAFRSWAQHTIDLFR